jgi:hypothetical protein
VAGDLHTFNRDGVFYWRRRRANGFVQAFGRREIVFSLRTRDPQEALHRSADRYPGISALPRCRDPNWGKGLPGSARRAWWASSSAMLQRTRSAGEVIVTRDQLLTSARKIQAIIADPRVSERVGALAAMHVHSLHKKPPSFFWSVLGHATPVSVQDEMTATERLNWMGFVKIVALVRCSSVKPEREATSIASALLKGGFSRIRCGSPAGSPGRRKLSGSICPNRLGPHRNGGCFLD